MFALSSFFLYLVFMHFYQDKKEIHFSDFENQFPAEAKILGLYLEQSISFQIEDNRIKLESPYSNPVFVDAQSKLDYHKKYFYKHSIYKEPLAKAVGIKKGQDKPHILDATAGLLGDTLLMYAMGANVECCERNPIAAALCLNAINTENLNIKFHFSNVSDLDLESYDVLYFDPMYSEKNDKARPKKEMQIFRDIVGIDADAKEIALNLKEKSKRLVIKRSIKAQPLLAEPTMTYNGKSTSYDVYLNPNK
jgi:16S rRNA (guanine1516-N2)-methyltransferase